MRKIAELFELSRGGESHNVRAMEGLRGFAVFLVFLTHYAALSEPWVMAGSPLASFMKAVHSLGNAGVDLFFILSGYLIYGSLIARAQPYGKFMKRRVIRIYPAFTAVFLLYIALWWSNPTLGKIPAEGGAAALYLLQNFLLLPGLFPIEPMITVAWSLSYEMFFYLALPPLIVLLGLRRRRPAWRIACIVLLAAAHLAWCAAFGGHWRMVMFAAGMVLFDVIHHTRLPAPRAALAFAATVAALALAPSSLPGPARMLALLAGFYLLCHACFTGRDHWLARSLRWTPLRWLGNMSYSYYLLHGLAMKVGFMALAILWPSSAHPAAFLAAMLLPILALTLVPTSLLFLLIERPMSLAPALGKRGIMPDASAAS